MFEPEEEAFSPDPSAVSRKGSVLSDDTMAGNQDANLVGGVGAGNGSNGGGLPDPSRQVVI